MLEFSLYNKDLETKWDVFVNECSLNGTFLHTRKFFQHNLNNAIDDSSMLFLKKGKVIAVLPASTYQKENRKIFHSHPRATYGGFAVNKEVGVESAVEMVGLLVNYARESGIHEVIVRNPFRIFHKALADETDYAMWYHGFAIKSREIETAIKLGDYEEVQKSYDDSTRRSIKKSANALVTGITSDYKTYWNVLEENLVKKYNTRPTHSYQDFLRLVELVGEDKIKLFIAEKDNQVAGGIIAFLANEKAIHAQYIASNIDFQEYRPLNAVIDSVVRWGCERGYDYFNLGTSNTEAGRGINQGLFRFKEGFGGRGVLRETMHLIL